MFPVFNSKLETKPADLSAGQNLVNDIANTFAIDKAHNDKEKDGHAPIDLVKDPKLNSAKHSKEQHGKEDPK